VNVEFESQCAILGQFWIEFRDNDEFKEFIVYNDMGLPMAYLINEGLVLSTQFAEKYIEETFDLFLAALDITDEELEGVDNLTALLDIAYEKKLPE
jgi:hypothetical protein